MTDLEIKIQKYLEGKLSDDEIGQFEEEMSQNASLKQEVEALREMMVMYDQEDWQISADNQGSEKAKRYQKLLFDDQAQDTLSSIKDAEKSFHEKQKPGIKIKWALGIVALILLLIFIVNTLKPSKNNASLYAENIDSVTLPSLTSRNDQNILSRAEKLFNTKEYKEALTLFNEYKSQNSGQFNSQLELYRGLSYLHLDMDSEAEETFSSLITTNSLDNEKAIWFLALTYLKSEQIEKCQSLLKEIIANPNSPNSTRSKTLLNAIESEK